MRSTLCTFVFLLIAQLILAQSPPILKGPRPYKHPNSVQLELGGSGVDYSLNYEGVFFNDARWKTAVRLGIGVARSPIRPGFYPEIRIPLMLNEQLSLGSFHMEVGAGICMMNAMRFWSEPVEYFGRGYPKHPFAIFNGGMRFQRPEGRLILKANYTPFWRLDELMPRLTFYNDRWINAFGFTVGVAI